LKAIACNRLARRCDGRAPSSTRPERWYPRSSRPASSGQEQAGTALDIPCASTPRVEDVARWGVQALGAGVRPLGTSTRTISCSCFKEAALRRASWCSIGFVVVLLLLSAAAHAQSGSGIAGVVKDTSGAVLPGVIVEAASPALIEKVRTVVTDGEGQYKIVDVRPGTYVVTFSLAGFTTLRREGIELPAGFTATVNAEMRVGAVSETVTVTGASPLVDTQNVRQSRVVENELLDALPIGAKSVGALVTLTPGFSGQPDVGGTAGAYANSRVFGYFHGKTGNKVLFDGMRTNNVAATGSVGTVPNAAAVEEMTVETGGASAESPAAGIVMNMIPKEGGNTFKFGIAGVYTNDRLQSDNLTDELRARGLTTVNKVLDIYDVGATVGGPIRKDRLWFFKSQRAWGNAGQMAAIFFNQTQGTPLYTPDRNRPAERDETYRSHTGRLTWQASKKNKVTFFADIQDVCLCRSVYGGNAAPEAVL